MDPLTHGVDPGLLCALGLPAIPPSGAASERTETCGTRVVDARVVERWEDVDRIRLLLQLGVELRTPDPAS